MTTPKATLEEMAELCQFQADLRYGHLSIRAKYQDRPADESVRHEMFVFDRAAEILRLMATFEDKSRAFIVALMKEHAGG